WFAVVGDMAEHTGRMADQRNWLARSVKRLEQRNGNRILSKVPHGAVSSRIKHGIEILRFHARKLYRVSKRLLCRFILLETRHCRRLIFGQIAFRIERRLSAPRGRKC